MEQIITEKDFSDVGYAKITNQSSIVGNRGQASSVIVSQKVAKLCSELQAEVERLKMDVPIDGEAKHVLAKLEQKLSTTTAEVEAACVIADEATFQQSQRKIEWPFGQAKASAVVAEGHQNVSGTFSKNSVEEKILSLESQLKIQASTHEAAVSAHNANVTEMEGRIRKFKASVVAAQTREKYLKELLHLAEANGNQTIEQINGLKKELSVAKAAAIAEELKCTELEVSLFAANKTEVLLRNQLATQMEASTNALRAASALSEHLLTQVKELEATISATHTEKEALQKSIESLSGVSKNTKEDVLKLQKELASKRAAAAAAAAKSEQELANVTARSCELEAEVETLTTKLASEVASREVAETAAASAQEAAAKASFAAAAMRTRSVAQAEDLKEEVRKAQAEALEAREEASAVLRHAAEALPEEQPKRGWLGRFGHRRGAAVVSPGDTNPLQSVRRKSAGKTGALKPVVEGNEPKGNLMPVSLRAMKLLALFCMSSLVTRALIP